MSQTTLEKLIEKMHVRVTKTTPDTRVSIAGSPFINPGHPDHDGGEFDGKPAAYAIIPAHAADAVKPNNKHYSYSEPFTLEDVKKK